MPTEAEACIERLDYLRGEAKKEIRGMTANALNWKPSVPDTNTPAAIVTHMAGTEAQWLHQFVGGMELQRSRDAEFAVKATSVEDLEALLDRTGETTRRILRKLSNDDMNKLQQPSQGREPVSYRWAALHTIEHLGQHLGHLSLTKQLYRAQTKR
ncbi:MAG: DUF664 domain-containing protein [Chloroflexi bacterium]|nr:DUF664 domain-containing protein [Chloroflexota bacterium]